MQEVNWILCPICGNKTRDKIREDTILKNFPLRDRLLWRIIGINADTALDGTPETVTVMLCNPPTRALLKSLTEAHRKSLCRFAARGREVIGDGKRTQDGRAAACMRCSVAACGHRRRGARKRRTGAHHHRCHANKRH